jgi:hypothetical protein
MTRSNDFFVDLAEDLGEWWIRVKADCELSAVSDWRRCERHHMEDAACELLERMSGLPRSVRDVVERRASGQSWTRISRDLPGRAYFSLMDDWRHALRHVSQRCDDLVRRLT